MLMIKPLVGLARPKPSHARIQLRRLSGPRIGPLALCAALLAMLVIASGASAAAGVNITATEGQSFTGDVVSGLLCPLSTATIDWGDGTTSAGTSDGSSGIQGTHTYAEEGTYNGSVTYTYTSPRPCQGSTQTASFQATVQDAALTWLGRNLTGTAAQPVSGVVAHFSDADPGGAVGDYSAQITWGDGTSSSGSVSAAAGGGFDVIGTHTYTSPGNYPVNTSITDLGGASATASSTAQIAATPPPPPTNLTPRFRVIPPSPCPETDSLLDASASTLIPGATFTGYGWSIDNVRINVGLVHTPVMTLPARFSPYRFVRFLQKVRTEEHSAPGFPPLQYDIYNVAMYRNPVDVTLDIQQEVPGRGTIIASQTTSLSFTNHRIDEQIGFPSSANPEALGSDYRNNPAAWIVDAGQRNGCPSLTDRAFFGVTGVPSSVALAKLARAAVVLGSGPSIKLRAGCKNRAKDCLASLAVLSRSVKLGHAARTRVHRSLPRSLGSKTFVVPAGKTISVSIHLNARGRALARAHKLHQVTLLLGSVGAQGKIVRTLRTVRLRTRR